MGHDHYRCPVPGEGGRLGAMLRAGACGMHADEAAVELLVAHGHWAGHGEFARRFAQVQACPDPARAVACIDWQAAAAGLGGSGLACSASEASVLRIAASLGGGAPVSLRAVLGGLDHVNIALVARAVLHANGTTSATVTVPAPPRFPPGIEVAGAGGRARPGEGR
jgi:hypothetical protein